MIVGFATLTSHGNGNGDLLTAASSPALSDGAIAVMALALWLVGIVILVLVAGARRISRGTRRSGSAE
jgi:chloramphenicol 3-O-phosphotransferase